MGKYRISSVKSRGPKHLLRSATYYCTCTLAAAGLLAQASAQAQSNHVIARIIEGVTVSEMDYPYVAKLKYQGDLLCTGTLISSKYVLSAAHCFFGENGQRAVGDTDLVLRLGGQEIQSAKVTINPSYVSRQSACVEGETDAALIELAHDVAGITPISIISQPVPVGQTLLLVGHGTEGTGTGGEGNTIPPDGYVNWGATDVEGYGDQSGLQNMSSNYVYWRFDQGEANTASGDSGGPAFYDINGVRYLASITCGGEGNAGFNTYSFNTRADILAGWINEIITGTPSNPVDPGNPADPGNPVTPGALPLDARKGTMDGFDLWFQLKGKLTLGDGFAPKGKVAVVEIGDYSRSFRLKSNGEAGRNNYFGLSGSQRNKVFRSPIVNFEIYLEDSAVFDAIGLPEDPSNGEIVAIPVTVTVNGIVASSTVSFKYSSRTERWKLVH